MRPLAAHGGAAASRRRALAVRAGPGGVHRDADDPLPTRSPAVAALLADLFGRRISPAAIQSALETASDAIAEAVAELTKAVEDAPVVGADETGWRDQSGFAAGKRCWLWAATTPTATVYAIAADRGIAGSFRVLGANFKGVVGCNQRPAAVRQPVRPSAPAVLGAYRPRGYGCSGPWRHPGEVEARGPRRPRRADARVGGRVRSAH